MKRIMSIAAVALAFLIMGAGAANAQGGDNLDNLRAKVEKTQAALDKARSDLTLHSSERDRWAMAASSANAQQQSAAAAAAEAKARLAGAQASGGADGVEEAKKALAEAKVALETAKATEVSAQSALDTAKATVESLTLEVERTKAALQYANEDMGRRSDALSQAQASMDAARARLTNSAATQYAYNQAMIARDKAQAKFIESEQWLRQAQTAYDAAIKPYNEALKVQSAAAGALEKAAAESAAAENKVVSLTATTEDLSRAAESSDSLLAGAKAEYETLQGELKKAKAAYEKAYSMQQSHTEAAAKAEASIPVLTNKLAGLTAQYQKAAADAKSAQDIAAAKALAEAQEKAEADAKAAEVTATVTYDVGQTPVLADGATLDEESSSVVPLIAIGAIALAVGASWGRNRMKKRQRA